MRVLTYTPRPRRVVGWAAPSLATRMPNEELASTANAARGCDPGGRDCEPAYRACVPLECCNDGPAGALQRPQLGLPVVAAAEEQQAARRTIRPREPDAGADIAVLHLVKALELAKAPDHDGVHASTSESVTHRAHREAGGGTPRYTTQS